MFRKILLLVLVPMPSFVKIIVLRAMGHSISRSAYIGMSYLDIRNLKMADFSYIGHGNIFTKMSQVTIGVGARVNRWNRFTATDQVMGNLVVGDRSAITLRHYLDCAGGVMIGTDTIIAGHRSTFFSHSKGLHQRNNYSAEIKIGDWCYVGSNVCVVPGFHVGNHCFVGMGAVLIGDNSAVTYALLAGNPARVRKALDPNSPYFTEGPLNTSQGPLKLPPDES